MASKNSSLLSGVVLFLIFVLVACGDNGNSLPFSDGAGGPASSNLARFTLDCDLNGLTGVLNMEVEAVGTSGVVWGPGPTPDISLVIATGNVIYYVSGSLVSPTASYTFIGENNYSDFTDNNTLERFRVEWVQITNGLRMIINPFGPQPTSHDCVLTTAVYI